MLVSDVILMVIPYGVVNLGSLQLEIMLRFPVQSLLLLTMAEHGPSDTRNNMRM